MLLVLRTVTRESRPDKIKKLPVRLICDLDLCLRLESRTCLHGRATKSAAPECSSLDVRGSLRGIEKGSERQMALFFCD